MSEQETKIARTHAETLNVLVKAIGNFLNEKIPGADFVLIVSNIEVSDEKSISTLGGSLDIEGTIKSLKTSLEIMDKGYIQSIKNPNVINIKGMNLTDKESNTDLN